MNYLSEATESPLAPVVFMLVLLLGAFVVAQDSNNDLYGPQAPENAAWLRVINGTSDSLATGIGDAELTLAFGEASSYVLVEPGTITVNLADEAVEVTVEPEQFLTVARLPDRTLVIKDPALRDISRGLLGLLNLTGLNDLALTTPEGDTVVSEVQPGEAAALPINTATTALEVLAGDTVIGTTQEHTFERGAAYTVVALDGPEGTVLVLLEASAD